MEMFVARQPIFLSNEAAFGYELLYREGLDNAFPAIDADEASVAVLINSFLSEGLGNLTEGKPVFINFTEALLREEIAFRFPPARLVIEILETIPITLQLIAQLKKLKAHGYKIALDDFVWQPGVTLYEDLFALTDFIKVDFRSSSARERAAIEQCVRERYPHIILLAEKVETRREFADALQRGYKLFQGYFFAEPEIVQGEDIPANLVQYVRLLGLLSAGRAGAEEIAREIERDVSLSFKLLKLLNAPGRRGARKVRSIKQAVMLMGFEELRKWVYILALREARTMTTPSDRALLETSLFRAKMCEQIAKELQRPMPSSYFLTGMFSMIDTFLKRPMTVIFSRLSLAEPIVATLEEARETEISPCLRLAVAFDKVRWQDIQSSCAQLGIAPEKAYRFYLESHRWAQSIV